MERGEGGGWTIGGSGKIIPERNFFKVASGECPAGPGGTAIGQWIFDSLPSANHTSTLTTHGSHLSSGSRPTTHLSLEGTWTAVTRQYKLDFYEEISIQFGRPPLSTVTFQVVMASSRGLFLWGHPLQRGTEQIRTRNVQSCLKPEFGTFNALRIIPVPRFYPSHS